MRENHTAGEHQIHGEIFREPRARTQCGKEKDIQPEQREGDRRPEQEIENGIIGKECAVQKERDGKKERRPSEISVRPEKIALGAEHNKAERICR